MRDDMKTILAIDPGLSGGLAVRQFGKTDCHAMPETLGDVFELIASFQAAAAVEGHAVVCVLEEVGGFAGKAQPGSAMFKFGEHYGFVQGVVRSLGIRLELVRPQVWQKAFGLGTASRCASKTVWKNKLKAEAQRRYPQLKVTLKTADALLILHYALQRRGAAAGSEPQRRGDAEVRSEACHRRSRSDAPHLITPAAWTGEDQSGELTRLRSTSYGAARAESGNDGGPKTDDEDERKDEDDFPAAADAAAKDRNT